MLKRFVLRLTSPGFMLLCGAGAAGYGALHPAREATAHERYLSDVDPRRSVEEDRALTRPHRVACPICRKTDAMMTLYRTHRGAERSRIFEGLDDRSERPFDHVRHCQACQAQPTR